MANCLPMIPTPMEASSAMKPSFVRAGLPISYPVFTLPVGSVQPLPFPHHFTAPQHAAVDAYCDQHDLLAQSRDLFKPTSSIRHVPFRVSPDSSEDDITIHPVQDLASLDHLLQALTTSRPTTDSTDVHFIPHADYRGFLAASTAYLVRKDQAFRVETKNSRRIPPAVSHSAAKSSRSSFAVARQHFQPSLSTARSSGILPPPPPPARTWQPVQSEPHYQGRKRTSSPVASSSARSSQEESKSDGKNQRGKYL